MSETVRAEEGVQFPSVEGKRSSQAAGKEILADAVRFVDAELAERISGTGDWRKRYLGPVRDAVARGARSAKDSLRIATDGLEALHDTMVFEKAGGSCSIHDAFATPGRAPYETFVVEGKRERQAELAIPVRGEILEGDALRRKLDDWVGRGIVEPSCRTAVTTVMDNPDWLDLSDVHFAMLGAASEMGPLPALMRWGANVYAVDLPRPYLWEHIVSVARQGAGRLSVAVSAGTNDATLVQRAGTDLLVEGPQVRDWLASFEVPLIVGNYVYADGNTFVRLATAVDALTVNLLDSGAATGMAYLATPTDVFAVPEEVVAESRSRFKARGALKSAVSGLTGRKAFAPNYGDTVVSDDSRRWGIYDCLVQQQGPNYAIAKNVQRWRAMVSAESGKITSANVAPPSKTRSVTKNRILAAAYAGAGAFDVEIFAAETASALCAALLVHDLRSPSSKQPDHPYDMFATGAAHGGLWRNPHSPRSVLPLAVVIGLPRRI